MHYFIAALLASASLVAALPGSPSPSGTTVKPTATATPPISFDNAKQLFENTNNLPANPKVVPFLVEPKFSIQPTTSTAAPPKPSVVSAKTPDGSNNVVSSPPGIPKTGAIQIQPSETIPLSSVIGQNQSHPIDRIPLLNSRQACESYPYCCPDPRYLNENTAFPYSVIGRHWNNGLGCTGTLVGPRHVLTASHCISCKSPLPPSVVLMHINSASSN
jgi:V8-like Glu-specific endopeptidase